MNDINEKYLTRMLDSAKQGLHQVDEAIDAINKQLSQIRCKNSAKKWKMLSQKLADCLELPKKKKRQKSKSFPR
jgi:coenzyme F420-reducing hydrogenase alpha subunit